MARSTHGCLLISLAAPLLLAASLLSLPAGAEAEPRDRVAEDAELMRLIEESARLERAYRAEEEAAAARERAAAEAEGQARERSRRERERAEAGRYESAIAEQEAMQQDLLWAVTGRGEPRPEDERLEIDAPAAAGGELADPRIAAAAPPLRELPQEIFDSRPVEIAAGTWGNREQLSLVRRVLDADGDGRPELVRYVERRSGALVRQEQDRNYDGISDEWSDYESGRLLARVLDANDDGNPDVFESYRDGRVSSRELDRDDDGVRDVFYRYRGGDLVEERHDADNDGVVDLVIVYENRLRVRAEEDVDRDGRIDIWTRYVAERDVERVSRIERDRGGNGFADTFEIFESSEGKAVLLRREEDINGDGEIDVISFYVEGKLRRRQIANPDAFPM